LILYDESYNFLGMSEKILNKLGYEDLDEFCTYHKDFSELFEKENGLIYNFENFSWIDFVLYGGANKDRAIIKTKNGNKLDVKIVINEIKVKDEVIGMSKLFSITLVEKGIVEEQTQNHTSSQHINLSSMLDDNNQEQKEFIQVTHDDDFIEIKENNTKQVFQEESILKNTNTKETTNELDINLSFIKNEDLKDDSKTTTPSVSLDFLKDDEDKTTQKPQEDIEPTFKSDTPADHDDSSSDHDSDVVLNFFNSTIQEKEETFIKEQPSQTLDQTIPTKDITQNPVQENKTIDINIDFLKTQKPKEDEKKEIVIAQEQEKKDIQEPKIELNFLKSDEKQIQETPKVEDIEENKKEPLINLNFLKNDDDKNSIDIKKPSLTKTNTEIDVKVSTDKQDEPLINLNFLKDQTPSNKTDVKEDKNEKSTDEPIINLNFLNQQEEKETTKDKKEKQVEKTPEINLNFLKLDTQTEKDEQDTTLLKEETLDKSLEIKENNKPKDDDTPIINLNFLESFKKEEDISPEKKSQIIKQIKEDIDEIDQPQQTQTKNDHDNDEIIINDALKSILNIQQNDKETKPKEETTKPKKTKEKKIVIVQKEPKKSEVKKSTNFNFLENLDISNAQKQEILQEFLDDAKYNLNLIKKYYELNDPDSIKYLAVKIKSSAEILNLSDVTDILKNFTSSDIKLDEIGEQINHLSKKLDELNQSL